MTGIAVTARTLAKRDNNLPDSTSDGKNGTNQVADDSMTNEDGELSGDNDGENSDDNTTVNPTEEETEDLEEETKEPVPTRPDPVKAKGIYVSGPIAGTVNTMGSLVDMVNTTELNAMVIDVKNDSGEITYKMDHDIVNEIGAGVNYIRDIEQLVADLKAQDIYLIARVVAFKDPLLAEKKPEYSLKNKDGSRYLDRNDIGWLDPYNKEVWDYLVEVSLEAIEIGFDEIQFDYIRFDTGKRMDDVDLGPAAATKTKIDIITEFTAYAYEQLSPYAYVSADVYGTIIDAQIDQEIVGQDYAEMAKHLDYICPMVYPSHYANGSYDISYPDLQPYELILASLEASQEVLAEIPEGTHVALVRPWLQDFTAPWISHHQKYGPQQIRDQVKGVYDAGYDEWILWNGSNKYTAGGLLTD